MGLRCGDRRRRPSENCRGIGFPLFSQGKKTALVKCVYTFREVVGGARKVLHKFHLLCCPRVQNASPKLERLCSVAQHLTFLPHFKKTTGGARRRGTTDERVMGLRLTSLLVFCDLQRFLHCCCPFGERPQRTLMD